MQKLNVETVPVLHPNLSWSQALTRNTPCSMLFMDAQLTQILLKSKYGQVQYPHICQGGCFHPRLCVHLLVCEQDYTKTTEWISTKRGWKMGLGPEQTPLHFGVHLDKETDQH